MIKNPSKLPLNRNSNDILKILNEGMISSNSSQHLKKYILKNKIHLPSSKIDLKKFNNVFLIAVGKSAGSMSEYVSKKIKFKNGIIVVPKGITPKLNKNTFEIINAGHPLPNYNSLKAGKKLVKFLEKTEKNDFVIFLISGGGSALSVYPNSISLHDKILVNEELIRSGASINEISCIRKHLSLIKGGRLIQNMNCKGTSLLVSDVIGDDVGSISSGMTFYDKSTFADALKIIKKFSLQSKFPNAALTILKEGVNGNIPETPKKAILKN